MLVAGCWVAGLLVAGCWMLVAGCWLLDAGCWMLVAGCWLLDAGCWMLVATVEDDPADRQSALHPPVVVRRGQSVIRHPTSAVQYPSWQAPDRFVRIKPGQNLADGEMLPGQNELGRDFRQRC